MKKVVAQVTPAHVKTRAGTQVIYLQAFRKQNPVHRSLGWNGYWVFL